MADARSRHAVEISEQFADDAATELQMEIARKEMASCRCETALQAGSPPVHSWAHGAAEAVLFETPYWKPNAASQGAYTASWTAAEAAWRANGESGPEAELARQLPLLRDIFENPYRPAWMEPEWASSTVRSLAHAIQEDWASDSFQILADALEDAGCHDAEILEHCRRSQVHVRGCWVVDLLLGKE